MPAAMTKTARKPATRTTTKTATKPAPKTAKPSSASFTDAERAAMKEHAAELRASRRGALSRADGEQALLAKIAEMPPDERELADHVHRIVSSVAPDLVPRTWYGMPAWSKDGNVLCFFQNAGKFSARYSTIGFSDQAALDQGSLWATSFALTRMTTTAERELRALVRRAVG